MHVLIINGSPRVKKFSNTDKIIARFAEGFCENGNTVDVFEVSDRKQWDDIRAAFAVNKDIIIALPLYVECIPGLLLEFLETVDPKNDGTKLSFILQSGFAEGAQLRCGEAYLEKLAGYLGCEYGGTLVKGDNFSIRLTESEDQDRQTVPYRQMGVVFAGKGSFDDEECRKFTGPEEFPLMVRLLIGFVFRTLAKKNFTKASQAWGCDKPLDYRPYGQEN
ncbi:Multimeric flavodoxin WrbA [Ruminococcaceae bacterium YRB3002]|nr:Multimeric flavodoxin WrbA [Ruminococcaceae bacterium YRB3002]